MAALSLPIPFRLNRPVQAEIRPLSAGWTAILVLFPTRARTVHADARREIQNVAQNVSMSTKVNSPGCSENGVCLSEGRGGKSSSGT